MPANPTLRQRQGDLPLATNETLLRCAARSPLGTTPVEASKCAFPRPRRCRSGRERGGVHSHDPFATSRSSQMSRCCSASLETTRPHSSSERVTRRARRAVHVLESRDGDCIPDQTSLVAGQSCTLRVPFTPNKSRERGLERPALAVGLDGARARAPKQAALARLSNRSVASSSARRALPPPAWLSAWLRGGAEGEKVLGRWAAMSTYGSSDAGKAI